MTELERLIAKEDIRTLQARYVRIADSQDWTALSQLFLEDAPFTSHDVAGEVIGSMTGRREIAAGIEAGVESAIVIHHLFSSEIDVISETTAHGIWSMEDWIDRQEPADPNDIGAFRTMRGYGHYHVDYRKVDGVWFISDLKLRRTRLDFTR